ncbi:response regulator transcription factor [bacterium]|nr:response regulator transcription factor [bacterium]
MLTQRELEVLTLVCKGLTNLEIAEELCISSHTAKAHVCSIIRKFGVDNRTLAACYAVKNNLVNLDD